MVNLLIRWVTFKLTHSMVNFSTLYYRVLFTLGIFKLYAHSWIFCIFLLDLIFLPCFLTVLHAWKSYISTVIQFIHSLLKDKIWPFFTLYRLPIRLTFNPGIFKDMVDFLPYCTCFQYSIAFLPLYHKKEKRFQFFPYAFFWSYNGRNSFFYAFWQIFNHLIHEL